MNGMTEMKARAGEGVPMATQSAQTPGAEVKTALDGFLNAFRGFQSEMKQSLQHQEERLTMLDRKQMTFGRPALATSAEV
jgi:hypothetical protein